MQLWSKLHLITLLPSVAGMILLSALIGWLLRKKSDKIKMIPIQIIAVVIIVLEIFKQIHSAQGGYDLYMIPLHFCSLYLYMLPFMSFYFGKHKDKVRTITLVTCTMLFGAMMIYPTIIYGEGSVEGCLQAFTSFDALKNNFLSFHTVVYHNLILFAFFLIISLKLFKLNKKSDLKIILFTFLGFNIISASMANVLKTNYNNFYYSGIGPVNDIRLNLISQIGVWGQVLYVLFMALMVIILAYLSYGVITLLTHICNKIRTKRNSKQPPAPALEHNSEDSEDKQNL